MNKKKNINDKDNIFKGFKKSPFLFIFSVLGMVIITSLFLILIYSKYKKIKIIILPGDIVNKSFKLRKYGHLKKLKEKMNLLGKNI